MVNPKKEGKSVKIDSVVLEFSNLEKNISSLKKELDALILIKENNEKEMSLSKETILKLVSSYERKFKEKEAEIKKEKEYSFELSKDYDDKLRKKDEEIKKIILSSDDSPLLLRKLEEIGIPKDIVSLKKSELCKLLNSSMNENKQLLKKVNDLENEKIKLNYESKVSNSSYIKRIDDVSSELKRVVIEKRNLESKNENYSDEIMDIKKKVLDIIKTYDENIVLLRKENEKKISEIINNSAKKDVSYKTNIIMLEKQIDEYKKILFDSKNKREDLLKVIEERIKTSISSSVADAIIRNEKI